MENFKRTKYILIKIYGQYVLNLVLRKIPFPQPVSYTDYISVTVIPNFKTEVSEPLSHYKII